MSQSSWLLYLGVCLTGVDCARRQPQLAAGIAGVFTYGAPRIGDAAFARTLQRRFRGRLFRYAHAADMVVKLPHRFQGTSYAHHAGLRFLTSFTLPGRSHRRGPDLPRNNGSRVVRVLLASF